MELLLARLPGGQVSNVHALLIFDRHDGTLSSFIISMYFYIRVDRGANWRIQFKEFAAEELPLHL